MEIWEASAQNTLCAVAAISPLAVELFGAPSSSSHAITDEESSLSAPLASHGRPIGIVIAMRLTRRVSSEYWTKSKTGSPLSVVNKGSVGAVSLPSARLIHPKSPPALLTPTRTPEVCCSMTSRSCSLNNRCTFFCLGHTQQAPTSTGSSVSGSNEVSVLPPGRSRASTMTTSDGATRDEEEVERSLAAHESPARPAPTMTTFLSKEEEEEVILN
mmetsp:Transcript_321/g.1047  ORF Transcript_321/g.1047 Transcript_321/m.1047 type:complete len:215 (+) Transcript_321:926-1570(+)